MDKGSGPYHLHLPVGREFYFEELPGGVGQEPITLYLDHLVTLTGTRLQTRTVEHGDPTPKVMYQSGGLHLPGRLGHPPAAHAQHIRDHLMRHMQFMLR